MTDPAIAGTARLSSQSSMEAARIPVALLLNNPKRYRDKEPRIPISVTAKVGMAAMMKYITVVERKASMKEISTLKKSCKK